MLPKISVLFALLMWVLAACTQATQPPPTPTVDPLLADDTPKAVEFNTQDGVAIRGVYYPSITIKTAAPALLLVHMLNSNKESWQNFAAAAQQAGYAVLAIDLRGHGQSDGRNFDFSLMDNDLDAAINWLSARPELNQNRLGLIGASIGANLALRAGSRYAQVKTVVLLSPGLDYRGVTSLEALGKYGQRPVMLVAAEKDTAATDSARTLNSRALGQHQLQIYPGSDHGTAIFQAQAGLQPMLLAWLASTIK